MDMVYLLKHIFSSTQSISDLLGEFIFLYTEFMLPTLAYLIFTSFFFAIFKAFFIAWANEIQGEVRLSQRVCYRHFPLIN